MERYHVVELIGEGDDLIGYGICREQDGMFWMLPEVHSTRSSAHAAIPKSAR